MTSSTQLPTRKIPGDYGLPFFGPIADRYNYFYNQGEDEFFKTRIKKYQSTVFRTNMPPGPFITTNSKVVAVLDTASFPILFDTTKVEKKDILDGTYMPSTSFFGGYRVCAFLDPSEPKHAKLKQLFMSLLASRKHKFIPFFQNSLSSLFDNLESELSENSNADYNTLSDNMSFDFVFRLFFDMEGVAEGESTITNWLALQLAPIASLGLSWLPNFIEDMLLRSFKLPSFLVQSGYNKIYKAVYKSSTPILDEAEKMGITREEACHNLVFLAGFNAYGGMKRLFPSLIKWIGSAGEELHKQLADEIRAVTGAEKSLTFSLIEKMPLTKSVVYEALRIEPPVPYMYGKAKEDLVVQSHEAAFEIKKDEVIFGYQPIVTKDSKVFKNAEMFVANRFVGPEGEELLKYVYWSNACETDNPTVDNKQCPGKDLVILLSRMVVVELFLRYDTFTVQGTNSFLGSKVTVKSLTKRDIPAIE